MKLVAACSDLKVSDIEALYRLNCPEDGGEGFMPEEADESVEQLECSHAASAQKKASSCGLTSVLTEIGETARLHFEGKEEEDDVEAPSNFRDPDADLPDGEQLVLLTSDDAAAAAAEPEPAEQTLPQTLTDALSLSLIKWYQDVSRCITTIQNVLESFKIFQMSNLHQFTPIYINLSKSLIQTKSCRDTNDYGLCMQHYATTFCHLY